MQRRRFRRLDKGLRDLFGYASYQGRRFLRELTVDVATALDQRLERGGASTKLASGVRRYAVIAEDGAVAYEFRHGVFYHLAHESIERLPKLARQLNEALLQIGDEWLRSDKLADLPLRESEAFHLLMLEQASVAASTHQGLYRRLLCGVVQLDGSSGPTRCFANR